MDIATIVKLNHEELPRVMALLELEHRGEEESARRLLARHKLELICITRGSNGSLLISERNAMSIPGLKWRWPIR